MGSYGKTPIIPRPRSEAPELARPPPLIRRPDARPAGPLLVRPARPPVWQAATLAPPSGRLRERGEGRKGERRKEGREEEQRNGAGSAICFEVKFKI